MNGVKWSKSAFFSHTNEDRRQKEVKKKKKNKIKSLEIKKKAVGDGRKVEKQISAFDDLNGAGVWICHGFKTPAHNSGKCIL